jgi:nicotinate-nucleotide--dimethylbenzimidazole phosphoribosyltransferase
LESIQALGQNETSATQADAGATAYATTAAGYGTQATAQTDYQQAYQQQAYQQQAYQPAAAQPAAAVIDDSLLSAFEESEPAQTLTAGQQTQAVAVAAQPTQVAAVAQPTQAVALPAAEPAQAAVQPAAVQPVAAQPVAAQPVAAAEPKVVNQWSDDKGHTWRVMSDGTNRWWNGTAWQKV